MFISESEVGKAVSSKEHAVPTRKDSLFPSGAVPPAITTVSASFVHPGAALQAVAVSSSNTTGAASGRNRLCRMGSREAGCGDKTLPTFPTSKTKKKETVDSDI